MPRPERLLPSDGGPIAEFAKELRALREKAGSPKYLQMARRTGRSRTALTEAAGGDHVPSWDTVRAFVEACDDDPARWLLRWEQLREDIRQGRTPVVPLSPSQESNTDASESADDVTIVLRLWQEQRDQARQCENHRAALSALIALSCIAAGIASVATRPGLVSALLGAAVMVLAGFGALSSHKYYERHQMHMTEAHRLRQQLDRMRPHLEIERTWSGARSEHEAHYPLVYRLRLHHLWVIVHLVLVAVGGVLVVGAGLAGGS